MSNHAIGYALSDVGEFVLQMFDDKRIYLSAAKELLKKLDETTCGCDGNPYEFFEFFTCRCGVCLKKVSEEHVTTDLYHGTYDYTLEDENVEANGEIAEKIDALHGRGQLLYPAVCPVCWDKIKDVPVAEIGWRTPKPKLL